MKKIEYSTPYANHSDINGYVMAEDHGDYYIISKRAYNRAHDNMTVGNVKPCFHSDKTVMVIGVDIFE